MEDDSLNSPKGLVSDLKPRILNKLEALKDKTSIANFLSGHAYDGQGVPIVLIRDGKIWGDVANIKDGQLVDLFLAEDSAENWSILQSLYETEPETIRFRNVRRAPHSYAHIRNTFNIQTKTLILAGEGTQEMGFFRGMNTNIEMCVIYGEWRTLSSFIGKHEYPTFYEDPAWSTKPNGYVYLFKAGTTLDLRNTGTTLDYWEKGYPGGWETVLLKDKKVKYVSLGVGKGWEWTVTDLDEEA